MREWPLLFAGLYIDSADENTFVAKVIGTGKDSFKLDKFYTTDVSVGKRMICGLFQRDAVLCFNLNGAFFPDYELKQGYIIFDDFGGIAVNKLQMKQLTFTGSAIKSFGSIMENNFWYSYAHSRMDAVECTGVPCNAVFLLDGNKVFRFPEMQTIYANGFYYPGFSILKYTSCRNLPFIFMKVEYDDLMKILPSLLSQVI